MFSALFAIANGHVQMTIKAQSSFRFLWSVSALCAGDAAPGDGVIVSESALDPASSQLFRVRRLKSSLQLDS